MYIYNLLKQRIPTRNVSYISLTGLKEMARKRVGEVTHEDRVKACEHVKTVEEQH
jgi:hypothetical protein